MIPAGVVTQRSLDDGDVITRAVLDAVRVDTACPGPPPPSPSPVPDRMPLAIARPGQATPELRRAALAWLGHRYGDPAGLPAEESLLHAVESSALVRPPVARRAARLDSELAIIHLWLARHWIRCSAATGDLRYLNAALKLTAAALLGSAPAALGTAVLGEALGAVGRVGVPGIVQGRRPPRTAVPESLGDPAPTAAPKPLGGPSRARIAVLAAESSGGLPLFLAAAAAARIPVSTVLLYAPGPDEPDPDSVYAAAWYPRPVRSDGPVALPGPGARPPVEHRRIAHQDWSAVSAALRHDRTDLLVLLGMGIVPAAVLAVPALGTVNAHNGALPGYRGMDAVAWAVLAGEVPVCSVHLTVEEVDAGDVLACRAVPAGRADLRRSVKDTQIALLAEVCRYVGATGRLPAASPQRGVARRHYRMHPALRAVLDAHTAIAAMASGDPR